jgi:hypothetical protein
MCDSTTFVDGRCGRCGRRTVQDVEYVDDIEMLAKDVVNAAYDYFGDLREGPSSVPELQLAIVRLADRLRQYHYDGDGCLDHG